MYGVALGVLALGSHQLYFVEQGVPVHEPQAMRFTTPCVTPTAPLTQSFHVDARAIGAITLYPAVRAGSAAGAPGDVIFELRVRESAATTTTATTTTAAATTAAGTPAIAATPAAAASSPVVQRVSMHVAQLANAGAAADGIRVALPRAQPAGGREFMLSITTDATNGCVAFLASGIHLANADLFTGERPVFGDLLFHVHASQGTRLHDLQRWLRGGTGIEVPVVVLATLALAYALAMALLCDALLAGYGDARRSSVSGVSSRPSAV